MRSTRRKIKNKEITALTRQLATLFHTGIALTQSFTIMINTQQKESMRQLLRHIKRDIESGSTLTHSLQQHPHCFDALYCALIHVGEQSGTLDSVLNHLTLYQEKLATIKSNIRKALFYPCTVLGIALFITIASLLFIIPQFAILFENFNATLPALTETVFRLSHLFRQHAYLLLSSVMMSVSGIVLMKRHSSTFAKRCEQIKLHLPIIGVLFNKTALTRFARTLAITLSAGLVIGDALTIVANACGTDQLRQDTLTIRNKITHGQSMQAAIQQSKLLPNDFKQLISIGEQSGTLDDMLNKIADAYEHDIEQTIDKLSTLLEPAIMLIIGGFLGVLIIALYLPIFQMATVI